jgi:hypothetical protein
MADAEPNQIGSRFWVLLPCIFAMLAIANLQYAWTLFTTDLTKVFHARLDAVVDAHVFHHCADRTLPTQRLSYRSFWSAFDDHSPGCSSRLAG